MKMLTIIFNFYGLYLMASSTSQILLKLCIHLDMLKDILDQLETRLLPTLDSTIQKNANIHALSGT
jgi:hypothetical protein